MFIVFLVILVILYSALTISVLVDMLLHIRDHRRALTWILFILLAPGVGLFFYFFLGKNYRKTKIFQIKKSRDSEIYQSYSNDFKEYKISDYPQIKGKERLVNLLLRNSRSMLTDGNKLKILQDGEATALAINDALKKAKNHIHLQFYIMENGKWLDEIFFILRKKVKEGVNVRVIYDGVGSSRLDKVFIQNNQAAGIEMYSFMPVKFSKYANKLNYRNHRKIIVIDGITGFTGGINISDKYLFGDEIFSFWRDTHLRIEGAAVQSLQTIFLTDWFFVSKQYLLSQYQSDEIIKKGDSLVQIVASGPDANYASIKQEYFSLITTAEQYIYISTPYFVPDENIIFSLKTAALSGVDVRMLIPGHPDSKLLKWTTQSYLEELLEAGVKFYYFQDGFLHNKIMVTDDVVASIGTANVDERSLEQNFEVNALIYDKLICLELKDQFFKDIKNSIPVDLPSFQLRPIGEKLFESSAKLLSPLL